MKLINNKKTDARRKMQLGRRRDNFELWVLALPAIILLIMFNYMPMFGAIVAFKRFNPMVGIMQSDWVGFENFKFFFRSSDAWRITRNTVLYSLSFIILDPIFASLIAMMMYNLRSKVAMKVYNTIMILPHFLSAVLIAFIVYAILNPVYGLLNSVIEFFGGPDNIDWYSKVGCWPFILTIVHIWMGVGMNAIVYYASLVGIDNSILEAAAVDGANKWQQAWYILIPHLKSIIVITTVLAFGKIFQGDFGLFYQTTMDVGMLYPVTDIIPTYVFRGLKEGNMGTSSAVGLLQSVVGLIMILLVNAIVKKIEPEHTLF